MAGNFTFSMIKPRAVEQGKAGPILCIINEAGFRLEAIRMDQLSREQAEAFYTIHRERPFFGELVDFMTSGPIIAMILEKKNAVEDFRKLIGSTDPLKAGVGTIRQMFADSLQMNAIHGSDSDENAEREADFFFSRKERFRRETT